MIKASIVADSISPSNCRITTFVLEYPRFIHAEIMTHRVFSKNAASSRAIPIEKMIEQVIQNPAMPVWWGKNQSGMQAKEELDDTDKKHHRSGYPVGEHIYEDLLLTAKEAAKRDWLTARNLAIEQVKKLSALGLHKQVANRILEPWFNIKIILTGTDFENFFALRAHPDAQPEFQDLAAKMLKEYNESNPKSLNVYDWHVPFGDNIKRDRVISAINLDATLPTLTQEALIQQAILKIAIARCARVSYLNYEGKDDYQADISLCEKLFGSVPRHLSPTEHVAQCLPTSVKIANFRGWKQFRYTFGDQDLSDKRVISKKHIDSL